MSIKALRKPGVNVPSLAAFTRAPYESTRQTFSRSIKSRAGPKVFDGGDSPIGLFLGCAGRTARAELVNSANWSSEGDSMQWG